MIIAFFVILFIVMIGLYVGTKEAKKSIPHPGEKTTPSMNCPTCGSPARVYGSTWECTWCNDFGSCTTGGSTFTITVSGPSEEEKAGAEAER